VLEALAHLAHAQVGELGPFYVPRVRFGEPLCPAEELWPVCDDDVVPRVCVECLDRVDVLISKTKVLKKVSLRKARTFLKVFERFSKHFEALSSLSVKLESDTKLSYFEQKNARYTEVSIERLY
jgi:hypothetical protein